MLRRACSIRHESELPFDGGAALPPVFGLGGAGSPAKSIGQAGLAAAVSRASEPAPGEDEPGDANSSEETAYGTQPSGQDGVPEDMATMVLNRPALGASSAFPPNASADPGLGLRAELDPASDAAVMLRVAAGDEASFNYLAQKYQRPIVHFLFRMVGNQAIAEELTQEVFLRV